MKADLRDLYDLQEIYVADSCVYSDDLEALQFHPAPTDPVVLQVSTGRDGWSAVVFSTDLGPDIGCAVKHRIAEAPTVPGTGQPLEQEDAVICSDNSLSAR